MSGPERSGRSLGVAVGAIACGTFFLSPFAWQILTSFWPPDELTRPWPSAFTLDNYRRVFVAQPFLRVAANSLLLALATTFFSLASGATAAFALAKLRVPGRGAFLGVVLACSMFPPIATVSPLFVLFGALGLRDHVLALVLPYATFSLPLAVWMLTSFFRALPDELYRAARVDGCTPWQAFRRVLLPLVLPGLATTAILVFVFSWNEFLYALTFLSSPRHQTIPVAVSLLSAEHVEPWGEIAAASILATLPLVVVTVLFQRRVVAGLTAGAVKS